ncbi:hypothetical protein [Ktedonobacter robiniae]|uniref:hypothetical protein n=1 Tax=Ktedonobacter robiniae TaxID=2778365 RepID=UPI001915B5C9|nr:hypothetical protein [Ktedonobacter robiniae]
MTQCQRYIAIIVEPDEKLRATLREIFIEKTVFWPLVVSNCKDALRILIEEGVPEVLIVDNDLPDGTGSECFRDICALEREQHMVDLRDHTRKILLCHNDASVRLPRHIAVYRGPYDYETLARLTPYLRMRRTRNQDTPPRGKRRRGA